MLHRMCMFMDTSKHAFIIYLNDVYIADSFLWAYLLQNTSVHRSIEEPFEHSYNAPVVY